MNTVITLLIPVTVTILAVVLQLEVTAVIAHMLAIPVIPVLRKIREHIAAIQVIILLLTLTMLVIAVLTDIIQTK